MAMTRSTFSISNFRFPCARNVIKWAPASFDTDQALREFIGRIGWLFYGQGAEEWSPDQRGWGKSAQSSQTVSNRDVSVNVCRNATRSSTSRKETSMELVRGSARASCRAWVRRDA